MKKVTEINSVDIYAETGVFPWYHSGDGKINPEWVTVTFSAPQIDFLEKHSYTVRPHPRHNPTVEVFINEQNCTAKDLTVMRLLF